MEIEPLCFSPSAFKNVYCDIRISRGGEIVLTPQPSFLVIFIKGTKPFATGSAQDIKPHFMYYTTKNQFSQGNSQFGKKLP